MFNYAQILKENPNGVLATQENGKISTRVFQYLFSEGNKVYFCTNSEKKVYLQLQKNQNVSFCTFENDYSIVLSLTGEVYFVESLELKEKTLNENLPIKEIFKRTDNPSFKLFYIDVKELETFSFSEGTKNYTL